MRVLYALIVAALLGPASGAWAQPTCGDRAEVLKGLDKTYQEQPTGMGLSNVGGVVEIFTSPDGDTWTILITHPNGMSCLVVAGEYWEEKTRRPAPSLTYSP